jgi:hypothetical protein
MTTGQDLRLGKKGNWQGEKNPALSQPNDPFPYDNAEGGENNHRKAPAWQKNTPAGLMRYYKAFVFYRI